MQPSFESLPLQRPSMDALIDMKFITADCLLSDKWIDPVNFFKSLPPTN